jgi:hypothetical protein
MSVILMHFGRQQICEIRDYYRSVRPLLTMSDLLAHDIAVALHPRLSRAKVD